MTDGICSFAVWRPTANFGYGQGTHDQNRPTFFCDHVMAGWKSTLDDPGWREPNGVGVHFGIGKDGSISQFTNILDASWGNGVSGSKALFDRNNPRLAALEPLGQWVQVPYVGGVAYALVSNGVNLPNSHSISTEHEGFPEDAWTTAMLAADIEVKQWCLGELSRLGVPMAVSIDMLVGHYQIDAVNRANCPGPNWPRDAIWAAVGKEQEMPLSQEDLNAIRAIIKEEIIAHTAEGLVRNADTGAVYQIVAGYKAKIGSPEIFEAAGFDWAEVRTLPAATIATIPDFPTGGAVGLQRGDSVVLG